MVSANACQFDELIYLEILFFIYELTVDGIPYMYVFPRLSTMILFSQEENQRQLFRKIRMGEFEVSPTVIYFIYPRVATIFRRSSPSSCFPFRPAWPPPSAYCVLLVLEVMGPGVNSLGEPLVGITGPFEVLLHATNKKGRTPVLK